MFGWLTAISTLLPSAQGGQTPSHHSLHFIKLFTQFLSISIVVQYQNWAKGQCKQTIVNALNIYLILYLLLLKTESLDNAILEL